MLGTVQRGEDVGALAVLTEPAGDRSYVIVRGDRIEMLPQRKVAAALEAARRGQRGGPGRGGGRPPLPGSTRVQVTLDAATVERLRELGNGNISLGIRRAAAHLP